LSVAELLLPRGTLGQATKRITNRRGVLLTIELVAVRFGVMQANMIGRWHALDVRGPIVASVEVDVVAMRSGCI
jgi:hypothetical protein